MNPFPDDDTLPQPIELQDQSVPLASLAAGAAIGDVLAWSGVSWVSATPGAPINGVSGPLTGSTTNALSRWTNVDGNRISNSTITLSDVGVFSSLNSASDVNSSEDFKINNLTVLSAENTNTFAGLTVGYNITTGINNVGFGLESLKSLLGGSRNVSLGSTNLTNLTTGTNNVSLGAGTALDLITGSNNIILGTGASAGGSNAQSRIILGNGSGIYNNGFHIPASSKFYFPLLESTVPLSNVLYYDSINGTIAQGTLVPQSNEFLDSLFRINDFNDTSAQLAFDCSDITSSTTRTIKIPNANMLLPVYSVSSVSTGNLSAVLGNQNTYYGIDVSTSSGNQNTAIGYQSAKSNLTGSSNLSVGYQSGYLTTGSNGLSIGNRAAYSNTTGQYNTVVGHQANYTNSTGNASSVYGYQAAYTNQSSNVSAFGYQSLYSLTSGDENSAFGYQTLLNNTSGSYNTVFGYNTGKTNISGAGLTAFGSRSLETSTGNDNSAFGRNSLLILSIGINNVAFGSHAGISLIDGSNNTLLGYNADTATDSTTGSIVIGSETVGKTNTTSSNGNNILTIKTPVANQGAYTNTFRNLPGPFILNYNAATEEITYVEGGGGGSTFLDDVFRVLNVDDLTKKFAVDCQYITTATTRTFIIPDVDGIFPSLDAQNNLTLGSIDSNITDGTNNTIIGKNAGASITTGTNNILIGYAVDTTYSNSILVGSSGTANNQIRIGFNGINSLQTNTYIDGIYNNYTAGYIVVASSAGLLGSSNLLTINNEITANSVFEATVGAQIGYATGTVPPENGLIVAGSVGIGTETPLGILNTSGVLTELQTIGSFADSQAGVIINNTFEPAISTNLLVSQYIQSTFISPDTFTASSAAGLYVSNIYNANVGIITNAYGILADSGSAGTGTIENAYGGYFKSPLAGVSRVALYADSLLVGYNTTNTSASTTTLTNESTTQQFFTGTLTQTVVLPIVSTLFLGYQFIINNRSTQNITVQSSGLNTITVMPAGTTLIATCILTTGTNISSWDVIYDGATSSPITSISGTANQVLVNGTAGTPQTGIITLTLPQSINTTSSPTFAGLTTTGTTLLNSSTAVGGLDAVQVVGNITIGATASSTTGVLRFTSGGSVNAIQSGLTATGGSAATLYFTDYGQNNIWMRLTSTGRLTIGSATATDMFNVGTAAQFRVTSSGVVSAGSWNGSNIGLQYGGTNANLSSVITGAMVFCNGSALAYTAAGSSGQILVSQGTSTPIWSTTTFPTTAGTAGTILRSNGTNIVNSTSTFSDTYTASNILYSNGANTVVGLATANNGVLITSGAGVPSISSTLPTAVQTNITQVGTITTGVWSASTIALANGGTNANITVITGAVVFCNATGLALTAVGLVGQVLQSAATGTPTWTSTLNSTIQTNITQLGTITTGTWNASIITGTYGGTGVNNSTRTITVSAGSAGRVLTSDVSGNAAYSTSTYPSTAGTAGTILRSNGTNIVNSTSTFADTYSASNLLYSNGANTVVGLATANNGVLITSGAGVPSISSTLPTAVQTNITQVGTITTGVWNATVLSLVYGGTNVDNSAAATGGIAYKAASTIAITAAGSAGQLLRSNGASAPTFTTATYPSTAGTVSTILRSDGTNWVNTSGMTVDSAGAINTTSTISAGGSLFSGSNLSSASTGAYNAYFTGTQTITSSGLQYTIAAASTLNPATGGTNVFAQAIIPTITSVTATVITNVGGIYVNPVVSSNAGTLTRFSGIFVDASSATGAGAINSSYGGYFTTPLAGTSRVALYADTFFAGYETTATAGGTTTLTNVSKTNQYFTGTLAQTVVLPVVSTLYLGSQYYINNRSSGVITVQSSGLNVITAISSNTTAVFTCITTVGTTASVWDFAFDGSQTSGTVTSILGTANQINTTGTTVVTIALSSTLVTPGTLSINAMTTGSVFFSGASGLVSQKNANFFWDNANNRLGINTATPGVDLDVVGSVRLTGTLTTASAIVTGTITSANATITSTLTTVSAVITGTITAANATVSGTITTVSARVTGTITAANATVSGTITTVSAVVTGTITSASAVVTGTITSANATITSTLTTVSAVVTGTITAANATVSGTITAATARVTGISFFGSTTSVGNSDSIQVVNAISLGASASSTTGVLRLISTGSENYIQSGASTAVNSAAPLIFGTISNATEWMRLTSVGRLTIGSTTATGLLNVGTAAQFQVSSAGAITTSSTAAIGGSLFANSSLTSNSTNMYNTYLTGTQTAKDGGNAQYALALAPTLNPTGGSASSFGSFISPTIISPNAQTIILAGGICINANPSSNVGTITNLYGIFTTIGGISAGNVTNSYGGYFQTQTAGTSKVALYADNLLLGYATTVTAAGTTTLTNASLNQQFFTGSTTQTVVLPVVSTLFLGYQFFISNRSSGVVTVQSSGLNTITNMPANTSVKLTCILTSGTGVASWDCSYDSATTAPVISIAGTSNQINASASTGAVTLSLSSTIVTPGTMAVNGALTAGTSFTATSAGSATNMSNIANFTSGGAPTAGNLYSIYIDRTGVEGLSLGVNKNTTTGSVPANSAFISTYSNVGTLSIGRGGSNNLPANVDIFIDSSGNVGVGTSTTSAPYKLDVRSTGINACIRAQTTTTGSANEGGIFLCRGDQANGYAQTHYQTGTTDVWVTGLRLGDANYHFYNGSNDTAIISTTGLGIGVTPTQALELGGTNAQLYLNSATSNRILFNANGFAPPTFTTRSIGTKIVLYPELTGSAADYAIGIDGSTLWFGVPTNVSTTMFKWYGGTTERMRLSSVGLTIGSTVITGMFNVGTTAQFQVSSAGAITTSSTAAIGGSLAANSIFTSTSSLAYNNWVTGTQTARDASSNQWTHVCVPTFSPTLGSTNSFGNYVGSTIAIPTSQTTTNSGGIYVINSYTGNLGTITNSYGVYVATGSTLPAGTLTNSYGGYFTTPLAGTSRVALYTDSLLLGYATIVTAAGTTTLTNTSLAQQFFTGSTTQTVVLPVVSTLFLGYQFFINNRSSGVVTVRSSGLNTITAMPANTSVKLTCILTSGTTAASWDVLYDGSTTATSGFTSGSVLFANASGVISQNNSSFFWDNTNNRLGIGLNTPTVALDVAGSFKMVGTSANIQTYQSTSSYGITSASPSLNVTISGNNYLLGFRFTVGASNLQLTHLGQFQNGLVFTTGTIQVAIYNTAGTQLATATVNSATPAENSYVYAVLSTPIILSAGTDYVILALEPNGSRLVYNGSVTFNSNITFVGYLSDFSGSMAYTTNNTFNLYPNTLSANFKYQLSETTLSVTNQLAAVTGALTTSSTVAVNGSLFSGSAFTSNSTDAYNTYLQGTQTTSASSLQYTSVIASTLNPAGGNTRSFAEALIPNIIAPTSTTIALSGGLYVSNTYSSNVGTLTNTAGLYVDTGTAGAGLAITSAYGGYFATPSAGISDVALYADSFLLGYATTATAGGTTTLTNQSRTNQYFTGSLAQTVVLPVVSTLFLGSQYYINNRSSAGVITVQSSGLNVIATVPINTSAIFTCILTTGTTAASWDFSFDGSQSASSGVTSVSGTTNQITTTGTTVITVSLPSTLIAPGTVTATGNLTANNGFVQTSETVITTGALSTTLDSLIDGSNGPFTVTLAAGNTDQVKIIKLLNRRSETVTINCVGGGGGTFQLNPNTGDYVRNMRYNGQKGYWMMEGGISNINPCPDSFYPTTQLGKFTGTGLTGSSRFGTAATLSADGTTLAVGGSADNLGIGAAWIFVRSGTTWIQQGNKLVGTGNTGTSGQSVGALSADGNTLAISGTRDNTDIGAVWIFTRSGTTWTQQGTKLVGTGSTGSSRQGFTCALSANGNTLAFSGLQDNGNAGAVWIFTRSGTVWTQQVPKIVGTGMTGSAQFGRVALSADGNTLAVGGNNDNAGQGAIWIFTRSGTTWTQQGTKLIGTGNTGAAAQGVGIALSADGNTLVESAWNDNSLNGAFWIFTRSGTTWTQQGSKYTANGINSGTQLGLGLNMSADGNLIVINAIQDPSGNAVIPVFTRSIINNLPIYTQQTVLFATGGNGFLAGATLSLSSNGNVMAVSNGNDNLGVGSFWIFT